jgi:lipopolysaccharide biosynthesis regulator YciM
VHLLIADIFERIGKSDDARRALEVAWRSSNSSFEVGVRLAELCIRRGEHAAALAVLQHLEQERPNDVRILLDLALVLWQQGAHETSVRYALQVLQSSKVAPQQQVDSLGEMAERLCDLAEHFDGSTRLAIARVAYELALAMSPGHHDAGIRLARLELRMGNPVAGVNHLMAVAKQHENSPQLQELASAYENALTG